MKEPYGEGVASHTDPESCVVSREAGYEVLTGAHAGRVSSREMPGNQDADLVYSWGRQHRWARYREHPLDQRGAMDGQSAVKTLTLDACSLGNFGDALSLG